MLRRDFLALAASVTLAPLAARAQFIAYTPGLAEEAMRRGDRIILNFHATWCSTCARQERIMDQLRAANPAYDRDLTLIRIDWDLFSTAELTRRLAVPRRSTIVALRGETELGRSVAGTALAEIRALFDAALAA